jgi:hypothetical protein
MLSATDTAPFIVSDSPSPATGFVEIKYALAEGDTVQWEVTPKATFVKDHVEYNIVKDKDGKVTTVTPVNAVLHFNGPAGNYTVTAFVINFDKKTFDRKYLQHTVGVPTPPTPPTPPQPAPPLPSVDLQKKIAEAFNTDKGTKADAVQLSALYKLTAKLCSDRKKAPSSRELLRQVREASDGLIGNDQLATVRTLVAAELATIFGSPTDTDLTDVQRTSAAELFLKLAAALDALLG